MNSTSSREKAPFLSVGGAPLSARPARDPLKERLSTGYARWAFLLLAAFLLLTFALRLTPFHDLDKACSTGICGLGGDHATQTSRILARIGSKGLYLLVPLMALVAWCCGRVKALKTYALILAGHCALLALTKLAVARPRPDSTSLTAHLDSYPSGHTMIAVILSGSLLLFVLPRCVQRWQRGIVWTIALFWPLLMGLSRIQWGRHYVTDVCAAYLLGTAWILLCAALTGWTPTPTKVPPQAQPAST